MFIFRAYSRRINKVSEAKVNLAFSSILKFSSRETDIEKLLLQNEITILFVVYGRY